MNSFRAERFEAFVELLSSAAELGVVFVTEREHGIVQVRQLRRGFGADMGPELRRVVRRFTVAPGASDDHGAGFLREVELGGGVQFHDAGRETLRRRFLRELLGQTLRRTALAAVEHEQWVSGLRRRGLAAGSRARLAEIRIGEESGEVAVQPRALLGREGRAAGNVRNAGHQSLALVRVINRSSGP